MSQFHHFSLLDTHVISLVSLQPQVMENILGNWGCNETFLKMILPRSAAGTLQSASWLHSLPHWELADLPQFLKTKLPNFCFESILVEEFRGCTYELLGGYIGNGGEIFVGFLIYQFGKSHIFKISLRDKTLSALGSLWRFCVNTNRSSVFYESVHRGFPIRYLEGFSFLWRGTRGTPLGLSETLPKDFTVPEDLYHFENTLTGWKDCTGPLSFPHGLVHFLAPLSPLSFYYKQWE